MESTDGLVSSACTRDTQSNNYPLRLRRARSFCRFIKRVRQQTQALCTVPDLKNLTYSTIKIG